MSCAIDNPFDGFEVVTMHAKTIVPTHTETTSLFIGLSDSYILCQQCIRTRGTKKSVYSYHMIRQTN